MNQPPRNLATSAQFDTWFATASRPGTYYTQQQQQQQQQRNASSHAAQEAFSYDTIGSNSQHPPPPQAGARDPARLDRPWRNSGAAFDSNQIQPLRQSGSTNQRDRERERSRSAVRSPPPKRSKAPSGAAQRQPQQQQMEPRQRQPREREPRQAQQQTQARGRQFGGNVHTGFSAHRGEFFDAQHIDSIYPELSRDEYRQAPKSLFENPKAFLWDNRGVNVRSVFAVQRGGGYRCNLVLNFPEIQAGKMEVLGDGITKVRNSPHITP